MISPYNLAKKLFPINRSISGKGNLKTLKIIKSNLSNLKIKYFNSGLKVFDWTVPLEWNITDAWIKNKKGKKIVDFKNNNLHIISYSEPINKKINYNDLIKKIYFLKNKPNAIPYITSYYKKRWGFCMSFNQFKNLKKDEDYYVYINSTKKKGKVHYAEFLKKGTSKKEIIFSSYICHPSMANNELSGPCILTALANWIETKDTKYSYRFLFIPETIGSIAYISKNINKLKKNILAGYVVSCIGDEKSYSFIPGPSEQNLSSKILNIVFKKMHIKAKKYSWFSHRGSDERQFCSPNVNLPFSTIMGSKFGSYSEYHTSLDKLETVVTEKGLKQSLDLLKKIIKTFESSIFPLSSLSCEPFLQKYNLYNRNQLNNSSKEMYNFEGRNLLNVLSCCDGSNNIEMISKKINLDEKKINKIIKVLTKKTIVKIL